MRKNDLKREDGVFHYYKKLLEMRKTEELVREGKYVRLEENDPSVWCYLREGEKEALLVIANFFGGKKQSLRCQNNGMTIMKSQKSYWQITLIQKYQSLT